ncbi:4-(cytidine 5'-diphospho)-2-C-methyl-D-erythritol kinase [Roseivivax sp. CAU 1761]
MIEAFAPAKVNLTLHVTGQRADGYHLLDSLVVFADIGDRLRVRPAERLSLRLTGPMADGVPAGPENLVCRAAELLDPVRGAAIELEKHLPAAAGIGGGSSDAAAALRALAELWGMPLPRQAAVLGADVPMCLDPRAARISGAGEGVVPVPDLPDLPALLVNPRVAVPTAQAFAGLGRRDNPPMPATLPRFTGVREVAAWLGEQRNDLLAPARRIAPQIDAVLEALDGALLARMSGSGATCFGLYPTLEAASAAGHALRRAHPEWWVAETRLNAPVPAPEPAG